MTNTIRSGLLNGRIRAQYSNRKPSVRAVPFDEALQSATLEDMLWAMHVLISRPETKFRTYRKERMKMIADRMMEALREL